MITFYVSSRPVSHGCENFASYVESAIDISTIVQHYAFPDPFDEGS